jgi:alginate O-acetyltransferase complex protein AlgJ
MHPSATTPPAPQGPASGRVSIARRGLVAAFAVLLALPLVQQTTGRPRDARLNGTEKRSGFPPLALRTWFDGTFARELETWYVAHAGFRGLLVKLGNQTRYSLFRRLPKSSGTPIVVGRDYWLYEAEYVRHYTRRPGWRQAAAEEFARTLRALQDALADRGIAFVLVISPSKPEIYPEFLPATSVPPAANPAPNAYATLRPLLDREGVRVVDAHALFKTWRARAPDGPLLFARGGTHWNYYGCFRCVAELLARAHQDAGLAVASPRLQGVTFAKPVGTDTDLLDLLNLFRFQPGGPPKSPYPQVAVDPLPADERPDALLVGDSFTFALIDGLSHARALRCVDLLYYFKRQYTYDLPAAPDKWPLPHTQYERGPVTAATLDWSRALFGKKLVILEMNEIMLSSQGWGFPEAALVALRGAPRAP